MSFGVNGHEAAARRSQETRAECSPEWGSKEAYEALKEMVSLARSLA